MSNSAVNDTRIPLLVFLFLSFSTSGCAAPASVTRSEFLSLGDDRLYYEVTGQGFPLVLVSGGSGMDLRQWASIIPTLAQSFRIISYDPRGVGKSDNPTARYSDSEDLEKLLSQLGIDRVGLIGLSSAGGFVLEFAALKPQGVAGVVASAPFVPGFEFSEPMMARLELFNQAAQKGRTAFLDSMFSDSHFIPAPLDASVRSKAREIMAENFDKGAGFDPSLQIALEPPLIEQISAIESPVLLLAGELDHPEVLRRNKFLLEQIPAAQETVIAQAGHNTPLENPNAFLGAIGPFIQRLNR